MATVNGVARKERGARVRPNLLVGVFTAAVCLSAFLLFGLQPMFTKMVLPILGGTPAVWSVAMVFFQAVLLLGYGYAHLVGRYLPLRAGVALHLLVLAAAFLVLPITVASGFEQPPTDGHSLWLIGLFAASVGPPCFALSANGPLLQSWFATTAHQRADNPYFLYAASNVGSFVALLGYPLLFEPWLGLGTQSVLWSVGFASLVALLVWSGALSIGWRAGVRLGPAGAAAEDAPMARARVVWLLLAFVPSAMLIAATAHMSTDVAAAPFLWVLPLATFLLTFVLTFSARGPALHVWMMKLQPIVIGLAAISMLWVPPRHIIAGIALHLSVLFVTAMVCHGELVRRRPSAWHLTEFYFWMSLGGVLGGIFSAILAPVLFPTVVEYPALIVLGLLARPGLTRLRRAALVQDLAIVLGVLGFFLVPKLVLGAAIGDISRVLAASVLVALAALIMLSGERPVRLTGLVIVAFVGGALYHPFGTIETRRSFFGVHKVTLNAAGTHRVLFHGTTIHGAERLADAGKAPEPLTYYHYDGAIAEAIRALRGHRLWLDDVAVVGLGSGSLACHSKPAERWRFYEIDPVVAELAQNPALFRFLDACTPQASIVLGDARLTLADAPERSLDTIIVDAFSSDAIPTHLLTREALALYFSRLKPHGAVVLHISNQHLNLVPVVAATAASEGLLVRIKRDQITPAEEADMAFPAEVAVIAREERDLGPIARDPSWGTPTIRPGITAWTDDFSNVLQAILAAR